MLPEDSREELDGSQRAGDSDDLACPVASPPTTSAPDAEAAPPNSTSSFLQGSSAHISPMLQSVPTRSYQEDEAHQHVDIPNQFAFVASGIQAHTSQSPRSTRSPSIQPDHPHRGVEGVHEDDGVSQNDGGLRLVAQSALAFTSAEDSSCAAGLDCRSSNEGEAVKQPSMGRSDRRRLRLETPPSHGRAQGPRQKARVDGLDQDKQCGSQGQRGTRTKHNLRPHPSKKRFFGECTDDEDEDHLPACKRRGAPVPASRRRDAQRDSEVPRVRGPSRARAEQRRKEDNAGAATVTGPSHAAIAMYEEWPLSDAILKCVHDNGTSTFQLQFTWATAIGASDHHDHTRSKPGSKGARSSTRARSKQVSRKQ